MLARGAQGNPWVFKQIQHFLDTGEKIEQPLLDEWRNIIFRHAELLFNLKEERIAASEMRKNLAFYFKGKTGATNYKILATQINTIFELKMLVNEYIAYYNSNISVVK
ncbi:tRNA-dihydrouridine synthase [Spiroplasma kunkelii]|uniref:tRNA-dihydrouridine synthase n=1 Tax=Spiroplasma kunkelii TaxID=47834 RepID=UPI000324D058|nr:tRNA-dihydrouridine synthase [Spiroplasma kunkelii]